MICGRCPWRGIAQSNPGQQLWTEFIEWLFGQFEEVIYMHTLWTRVVNNDCLLDSRTQMVDCIRRKYL